MFYGPESLRAPSGLVCPGVGVATTTATASPLIGRPLDASGPPGSLPAQLGFQVFIVRTHGPRADLFVDHVHAREAVETEATDASLGGTVNGVHPGAWVHLLPAV